MRMYVGGEWVAKTETIAVENPYDRSVVDTVPRADRADVERALQSAVRGARAMARLSGYDRYQILRKAADLMAARQEDLGRTISLEEGKILAEGRLEASRAVETILGSAEEAKRIHGETVPVDGAPGGAGPGRFTACRGRASAPPAPPRRPCRRGQATRARSCCCSRGRCRRAASRWSRRSRS